MMGKRKIRNAFTVFGLLLIPTFSKALPSAGIVGADRIGAIKKIRISPDNEYIAASSSDGNIYVYTKKGIRFRILRHSYEVDDFSFSTNNKYISVTVRLGRSGFWNLVTGVFTEIKHPKGLDYGGYWKSTLFLSDSLFIFSDESAIFAFDLKGAEKWRLEKCCTSIMVEANGGNFLTDTHGLSLISPKGEIKWSQPVGNLGTIRDLAIDRNSSSISALDDKGNIAIFDKNGRSTKFIPHKISNNMPYSIKFNNARKLLACDIYSNLKQVDPASGKMSFIKKVSSHNFCQLDVSQAGKMSAVGDHAGRLTFFDERWELAWSNEQLIMPNVYGQITANSDFLYVAELKELSRWSLNTGQFERRIKINSPSFSNGLRDIAFDQSSKHIWLIGNSCLGLVIDPNNGSNIERIGDSSRIQNCDDSMTLYNKEIIAVSNRNKLLISTKDMTSIFPLETFIYSIAAGKDSLFGGDSSGNLIRLGFNGEKKETLKVGSSGIYKLVISPEKESLLYFSTTKEGKPGYAGIYHIRQNKNIVLSGNNQAILKAIFSPDGKTFATIDFSNGLQVWSTIDGHLLNKWNDTFPANKITGIAFAKDGKFLILSGYSLTTRIFSYPDGKLILTLHPTSSGGIAYTPDGYFAGTNGASISYQNGKTAYRGEQFFLRFHRPDIIAQRLNSIAEIEENKNLSEKVTEFRTTWENSVKLKGLDPEFVASQSTIHAPLVFDIKIDPSSRINNSSDIYETKSRSMQLSFKIRDESSPGLDVIGYIIHINGTLVEEKYLEKPSAILSIKRLIELPERTSQNLENVVEITGKTSDGITSERKVIKIRLIAAGKK